jgi:hypothetical protein
MHDISNSIAFVGTLFPMAFTLTAVKQLNSKTIVHPLIITACVPKEPLKKYSKC